MGWKWLGQDDMKELHIRTKRRDFLDGVSRVDGERFGRRARLVKGLQPICMQNSTDAFCPVTYSIHTGVSPQLVRHKLKNSVGHDG